MHILILPPVNTAILAQNSPTSPSNAASSGYTAAAVSPVSTMVSGVENKSSANVSKKRKASSPLGETALPNKRLKTEDSGSGTLAGLFLRIKAAGDGLLSFGAGLISRVYGLYRSPSKPSTSHPVNIDDGADAEFITTASDTHSTAVVASSLRKDCTPAPALLSPRARPDHLSRPRNYDKLRLCVSPKGQTFEFSMFSPTVRSTAEINNRFISACAQRDRQESLKLRNLNLREIRSARLSSSTGSVSSASDSIAGSETDGDMLNDFAAECTGVKYIEANIDKESSARTRSLYGRGSRRFESGSFSLASDDTGIGKLHFSSASDISMGGTDELSTSISTGSGWIEDGGSPADQQQLPSSGQSHSPALSSDSSDASMGGTSEKSTDILHEHDQSEHGGLPSDQRQASLFGQSQPTALISDPMAALGQQPLSSVASSVASSQPQVQLQASASRPRATPAQSRGGVKKQPPKKRTGAKTGKQK